MTRNETLFKNATQIAEQRIRFARQLQAAATKRRWKVALAAMLNWSGRSARAVLLGKSFIS